MNDYSVGDRVEFRTKDGAEFRGVLHDFDAELGFFTILNEARARPAGGEMSGTLGFPFDMIEMMWAA